MVKSGGCAWWAFLLLVGVLLAAAAMPMAVGQWDCDAHCVVDHHADPWNVAMCVHRCHTSVQAAAKEDGKSREQEGGSGGDAGDANVERHHHDRGRCQHICKQHFTDYRRLLECIRRCQGRQEEEASVVVHDGAEDVNSDRARCQKACRQHFTDYHRLLQCIRRCQGRQEAAASVVVHGGADDDENREGGDRCKKQCQHYHDNGKRQQCVYHCHDGGSGDGFKTVVGAILEVV